MIWCGVDPGVTGGIAFIDTTPDPEEYHYEQIYTHDLPKGDEYLDCNKLADLVRDHLPDHAVIEAAASRPAQGVKSTFTFGVSFGQIIGVLHALKIKTTLVRPQTWKRDMGLDGANKQLSKSKQTTMLKHRSLEVASDLFPTHAWQWSRVKDNHRAEALLIAHWGRKLHVHRAAQ